MQVSHQTRVGPPSLVAPSHDNAEIVRVTRVARLPAQVSPVKHYQTRSQSSTDFSAESSPRLVSAASAGAGAGAATAGGQARVLPAPVPPPSFALPPTPSLSTSTACTSPTLSSLPYRSSSSSNGSTYAVSSILSSSSVRKNLKPLNLGLTQEEHAELVQKIITDLRPASHAPTTTAGSHPRAFSPAAISASAHQRLAANKMTIGKIHSNSNSHSATDAIDAAEHLSASSQSDEFHADGNANKLSSTSTSKSSTPQLSQSRTPTPTTPTSPSAPLSHIDEGETASSEAASAVLTPTAALESLRTLENSFQRSSLHLPREGSITTLTEEDSKPSSPTTAVATSPTTSTMDGKEAAVPSKRTSSYRKSVPTLAELDHPTTGKLASSPPADHRRFSSSTANTDTAPSWIPSLTTLEAVRVLAFQQDVAEALASPDTAAAAKEGHVAGTASGAAAVSADEVSALRYALKFAIARVDRLAEALSRAKEDKMKTEMELEILRKNVLSMLGSRAMFGSSGGEAVQQGGRARRAAEDVHDAEADQFDDARSRHSEASERSTPQPKRVVEAAPKPSSGGAATVARPARAARTKPTIKQTTPNGSVSIASLRKKNLSTSAIAPAQRYTPSRAAFDADSHLSTSDEEEDADDFAMFPFGAPRRRAAPEVSMSDFLNASRMSKIEIEQHDARRELEKSFEDDRISTNSRSPLAGVGSQGRRGLLKSIGRIVDQQRRRGEEGERQKKFFEAYQESIVPSYLPAV